MIAIKGADADAILTKGPQREGTGDNKGNGRRGYTDQGPAERKLGAIIGADALEILVKCPQSEGTTNNKGSGQLQGCYKHVTERLQLLQGCYRDVTEML